MIPLASLLIGAVVGLIAASMFTVILKRNAEQKSSEVQRGLRALITTVLGGGLADYVVFDLVLKSGSITYYMVGFAVVFLVLGGWSYVEWRRIS